MNLGQQYGYVHPRLPGPRVNTDVDNQVEYPSLEQLILFSPNVGYQGCEKSSGGHGSSEKVDY